MIINSITCIFERFLYFILFFIIIIFKCFFPSFFQWNKKKNKQKQQQQQQYWSNRKKSIEKICLVSRKYNEWMEKPEKNLDFFKKKKNNYQISNQPYCWKFLMDGITTQKKPKFIMVTNLFLIDDFYFSFNNKSNSITWRTLIRNFELWIK